MANVSAIRAPEAAKYLGLSTSTLAKMRMSGEGPIWAKLGRRVVVYRLADLADYVERNRRKSTIESKAA